MYEDFCDGDCPQCRLEGRTVELLLNQGDAFECPECHLQLLNMHAFAVIVRERGKGVFRDVTNPDSHGRAIFNRALPVPQREKPWDPGNPFPDQTVFRDYLASIPAAVPVPSAQSLSATAPALPASLSPVPVTAMKNVPVKQAAVKTPASKKTSAAKKTVKRKATVKKAVKKKAAIRKKPAVKKAVKKKAAIRKKPAVKKVVKKKAAIGKKPAVKKVVKKKAAIVKKPAVKKKGSGR